MTHPNPDLAVGPLGLSGWNTPERRRQSFQRLHLLHRRGMSLRSAEVLPLTPDFQPALGETGGLRQLLSRPAFGALVVVRDGRILLESYAPDFGPSQLHSMQSITKSFIHLAMGRLIVEGLIDPSRPIATYVPEAGSAYADVSVQQALDMNVPSNFSDDYEAPYFPGPAPGEPVGYGRQEIAMGWRLPPKGEREFGIREFAAGLTTRLRAGTDDETIYASPNTDMLGWVIERASGRPLLDHVADIVEAAGIEASFHVSIDCKGVPVLSGGGVMTARDLARYGLLIARGGLECSTHGHSPFLADAMSGAGTRYRGSPRLRYRNHLLSNGTWVGHPGYAGQFLMIAPEKRAVAAFYSVLETDYGDQDGYFPMIISVLEELLGAIG